MRVDRRVPVFLALIATGVTAWFCAASSDAPANPETETSTECRVGDAPSGVSDASDSRADGTPVHGAGGNVEKEGGPCGEELLGPGLGEFIFIQGGEFTMGRNRGEHEDQRPEHLVELSSFHIGRTPVTNAQFIQFLNDAGVEPDEYL